MPLELPKMLLVRQKFADLRIGDIADTVRGQMKAHPFAEKFGPGARIAIAVGSRGIGNLPVIVRSVVDYWKDKGCHPFIVPAMGSHGGATNEGQRVVLATRGITEDSMGCPIESSMDVVSLGRTPDGIETFMDKTAYESAGVFLVNRVNRHTDFSGPIESGLCKMAAIGLGKKAGAENYHRIAYSGAADLSHVIPAAAQHIFASGKIVGGLAILEDANNRTADLVAIPVERILEKERELLTRVKSWKGDIPVRELDVLVVDEIGKNISGPGMDPKVVNRSSTTGAYNPIKDGSAPWVGRIYVRNLHPDSDGNAMGVGMADIVHDRVLAAMDEVVTRTNASVAQIPHVARVPLHAPTDEECLDQVVRMTAVPDHPMIGWIRNSKELGSLYLSENLRPEIEADPNLEIIGAAEPFVFGKDHQLISPFPKLRP